jgi:WD40 repeat protein
VSGSSDRIVRLWDAVTGIALQTLEGHSDSVISISFSQDNKRVISGSDDKTVRLWDVVTGVELQTLKSYSDCRLVAFSPDGSLVVSSSDNGTVRLWDVMTGQTLQTLEGCSVDFIPDSKLVIYDSNGKTVWLWNARATAPPPIAQTLEGHSDPGRPVASSPVGKVEQALSVSNNWVIEGEKEILWLPPDYRATSTAAWNRFIALGHSSETISILGFKEGPKLI